MFLFQNFVTIFFTDFSQNISVYSAVDDLKSNLVILNSFVITGHFSYVNIELFEQ